MGILYFFVMIIASFLYRVPAKDWKPEGWNPETLTSKNMVTDNDVHQTFYTEFFIIKLF